MIVVAENYEGGFYDRKKIIIGIEAVAENDGVGMFEAGAAAE